MNRLFKTVTKSREDKVVLFQKTKDTHHKVLIKELELAMSIGILPEEQKKKQRVFIDLEIYQTPKDSYEENIHNTVSYADVIVDIESLTAQKHFNLVETLAEEVTDICFRNSTVQKVKITVKKPDIINNIKFVGFSMTKEQSALNNQ